MAGRPSTLKIVLTADASGAVTGLTAAQSSVSKLASTIKTALAAAAAVGVAKFAGDVVGAASKVQQSMGAVDAVFGSSAGQVRAWAAGAADSAGLAKSEYGQMAATMGAQLGNLGISQDKVAGQTNDLIHTGADLAAQFGGSTSDAVSALSALFRGEYDPIEKYGVSIKQSSVNAELAANGQDKLTGAARTQAETQAKLKLLTEQTTSAQGAFSRESETLANRQQVLGAKMENLKASIGEALLPAMTALVSAFIAALPVIVEIGRVVGDVLVVAFNACKAVLDAMLGPLLPLTVAFTIWAIQANATAIAILALTVAENIAIVATRAWAVVQGILNAVLNANPIMLVVLAIAALVTGLIWAYQNCETFRNICQALFAVVSQVAGVVAGAMVTAFNAVKSAIGFVVDIVGQVIGWFARVVVPVALAPMRVAFDAVKSAIGFVVDIVGQVVSWFARIVLPVALAIIKAHFEAVKSAIGLVVDIVGSVISVLGNIVVPGAINALKTAFDGVKDAVGWVVDKVKGFIDLLGKIPSGIGSIIGGIFSVPDPAAFGARSARAARGWGPRAAGPTPVRLAVTAPKVTIQLDSTVLRGFVARTTTEAMSRDGARYAAGGWA